MQEGVLGMVPAVTDTLRDQKWSQSLMSEKALWFSSSVIGNIILLSALNIRGDYSAVDPNKLGSFGEKCCSLE